MIIISNIERINRPEARRLAEDEFEQFAELTERPGVIPAPYSARAHWVALESEDALPRAEIRELLGQSYGLVLARLPKKRQAELQAGQKGRKV